MGAVSQEEMEALWFRIGNPRYPGGGEKPPAAEPIDEGEVIRAIEDLEDYGNPFAQYGPLFRKLLAVAKTARRGALLDVLQMMDNLGAEGSGNYWADLRAGVEGEL